MTYYPVFLDLHERWVLVVGGGSVATRKARQLLAAGARVRLVSREISPTLKELAPADRLTLHARDVAETDLDDVWLVIAATDDAELHRRLAEAARARRLFCIVVDEPARSTAISPAVVTRGHIQIAISTGGASPALAQHLREKISALIGHEYAELADLLRRGRPLLKEKLPDPTRRAAALYRLFASDLLDLLRAGQKQQAEERFRTWILATGDEVHGPEQDSDSA